MNKEIKRLLNFMRFFVFLGEVEVQDGLFFDLHIIVEAVEVGDTGWDLNLHDFIGAEIFEVFDDAAQAVPVGGHEDRFTGFHFWEDLLREVWDSSIAGILEAFPVGGGHVIAATPEVDLFFTDFLAHFVFVLPLKVAVMAFVEGFVFGDGNIGLLEVFEDDLQGVLSSTELGGEGHVKVEVLELLGSLVGFFFAFLGQGSVEPSGEDVLEVVFRGSVADQDKCSRHSCSFAISELMVRSVVRFFKSESWEKNENSPSREETSMLISANLRRRWIFMMKVS